MHIPRFKFFTVILFMLLAIPLFAQETQLVTHIVQPGENLFRIALRYGIDMNELSAANNITDARSIYSGQELIIPGLTLPAVEGEIDVVDGTEAVVENPLVAAAPVIHTVQRGEILSQIAGQYGVTVESVMQANGISNANRILVGDELNIWPSSEYLSQQEALEEVVAEQAEQEAALEEVVEAEREEYVVQRGEYLSQIARKFGVSWVAIAELNGITDPNTVYAGMTLQIPTGSDVVSQNVSYATYNNIQPATSDPGARIGVGRELVVVLSTQMTYAYEDGVLQYSALASTGLPATPTVQGDFKVWNKTRAQTMSGPGYYLENVEWVMYFHQGYGFHGTWWHENFGQPMSHGCVNLTNEDAKWYYDFAEVGTPVHVRFY